MNNKKSQSDLLNIIFGIIIISGGVAVTFDKINLGSLITRMGLTLS